MSGSYFVKPIDPKTIDQAYPLARIMTPALLTREWRQFCHSREAPDVGRQMASDREDIVVACNAEGYVKGLCVYTIRNHATYGRLLDVPFFVVASAADGEGVATELLNFLRCQCDESVCSGIRFWTMSPQTWAHRSKPEHIARSDHGLFMPALASAAEIETALCAHSIGNLEAIDRLSR